MSHQTSETNGASLAGSADLSTSVCQTAEGVPEYPAMLATMAHHAEARRAWSEAVQLWAAARQCFPDDPIGYIGGARALVEIGSIEPAETLLAEAQTRFPDELSAFADHARIAERQSNWPEAYARWKVVRARFPDQWVAIACLAVVLRELRRLDEADAQLREGLAQWPDEAALFMEHGQLAMERREWDVAAERWQVMRDRFPDQWFAWLGGAAACREQRRFDAAEALLSDLQERFPGEAAGYVEYARIADERRDWSESARRWAEATSRFPDWAFCHVGHAAALRQAGAGDDAEVVLAEAVSAFPGDEAVLLEHALIAHQRQDWPAAISRWARLRSAFPVSLIGYSMGAAALREARREDDAEALIRAGIERCADPRDLVFEYARLAQYRLDEAEALSRWQAAHARFPGEADGYLGLAGILRRVGRVDEARALLDEAAERIPGHVDVLHDLGRIAEAERDWLEAERIWRAVVAARPAIWWAHSALMVALQEQNRDGDVAAVWVSARQHVPAEPDLFVDYARLAERREDWQEAGLRWAEVRRQFPDRAAGYVGGAAVLSILGLHVEADTMIEAAADIAPDEPAIVYARADLAIRRRDWTVAEALSAEMRTRFPSDPVGYLNEAMALRNLGRLDEADQLLQATAARFPDDWPVAMHYAGIAEIRNDPTEELARWAALRQRFPDRVEAWRRPVILLRQLSRMGEAEGLAAQAVGRFPHQPELLFEYATVAVVHDRADDARSRFEELRERFPSSALGYLGGADAYRYVNRLAPARDVLAAGMLACPSNSEIAVQHAVLCCQIAVQDDAAADSVSECLRDLRARWPDSFHGHMVSVQILCWRSVWQLQEAAEVADEATRRWPDNAELALEQVQVAEYREEWEAMIGYARVLRDRFPEVPYGTVALARGLVRLGRINEAEDVLQHAYGRYPASSEFYIEYAAVATRRKDHAEAVRRWSEATHRFPGDLSIAGRLLNARMEVAEHQPGLPAEGVAADDKTRADDDATESVDGIDMSELVQRFESLGGDSGGCEFGLFQRACGAEPLSLLRWTNIAPDRLVYALETRFRTFGDPQTTTLSLVPEGPHLEYLVGDTAVDMRMRTFVHDVDVPYDAMFALMCRRFRALARKLVGDLEAGDAIFVYRVAERNLEAWEIDELHAAMRRFGDNVLLYVRYEDAEHPHGTVDLVRPGLMIGYIDRFRSQRDLSMGPSNEAGWALICRAALRMHLQSRAGQ